jgi:D-alanyl-D-alanine dipeptidase
LGAPYGETSPYYLRQSVLTAIIAAQAELQQRHPGWRIQIFDAYRPVAVQQFMVDHTFAEVVEAQKLNPDALSDDQRQAFGSKFIKFGQYPALTP